MKIAFRQTDRQINKNPPKSGFCQSNVYRKLKKPASDA
jgi:hypothetical protein